MTIYDKRDEFDFDTFIVFPFGYATSCGVYISQLARIAKALSQVSDFNNRMVFRNWNFVVT